MLGRRRELRGGGHGGKELHVNVPSFFRCPISLDVMRSPVSLCTGVTYDRASIQAWLDTGHNTCPATMQVLPSTALVPNHALHRLIQHWSTPPPFQTPPASPDALLRPSSSADMLPSLRKLAKVTRDAARLWVLAENAATLPTLHGILLRVGPDQEVVEAAVGLLSAVLHYWKEEAVRVEDGLVPDPRILPSLVAVLRRGSLESSIASAWVVEVMASFGSVQIVLWIAEVEGMAWSCFLGSSRVAATARHGRHTHQNLWRSTKVGRRDTTITRMSSGTVAQPAEAAADGGGGDEDVHATPLVLLRLLLLPLLSIFFSFSRALAPSLSSVACIRVEEKREEVCSSRDERREGVRS